MGLTTEKAQDVFSKLQKYIPEPLETCLSVVYSGFLLPRRFYRNQLLMSTLTLVMRLLEQNDNWEQQVLNIPCSWDTYGGHTRYFKIGSPINIGGHNERQYLYNLLGYYHSQQSVINVIHDILMNGCEEYFGANNTFDLSDYDPDDDDDEDAEGDVTGDGTVYTLHESGLVKTLTGNTHNQHYNKFYSKFIIAEKDFKCAA